jgi:tripartite-type tricarboxylate transporter receptor subunit TctC
MTSTPSSWATSARWPSTPTSFDKLPYDPNKDFQPVSLLAKVPSLYVVHPDVPVKN